MKLFSMCTVWRHRSGWEWMGGFLARYATPTCYTESKRTNCHGSEHQEISWNIHEQSNQKYPIVTKPSTPTVAKDPASPIACNSRVRPGSAFFFFLNPCNTSLRGGPFGGLGGCMASFRYSRRSSGRGAERIGEYGRKNFHLQHCQKINTKSLFVFNWMG